ncbi:S8 family peptidase [Paenibacillus alvei]|uniref:S8 family peptidase n=1 Tax=Paenibacillus alvei TaxID=44250 RepID=UPI0018CD13AB|nr:S8 family serine peptidase [Paenibacillus alvei]MCY9579271.1 S8 family serine peptidase [Paenibacillus alvei]MCY9583727.1 S8 family serine peptidase [Paenibacillus alvei]
MANNILDVLVEVRANERNLNEEISISAFDVNNSIIHLRDFQVDKKFKPIVMRGGGPQEGRIIEGLHSNQPDKANTFIIRGQVPEDKLEDLKRQENVVDVYTNPKGVIAPLADPVDCNSTLAKGTLMDVVKFLGVDQIWNQGFKGENIVIGIVDDGITAQGRADGSNGLIPNVIGGSREDWGQITITEHGNMTATDALGIAPNGKVFDLRIFELNGVEETRVDPIVAAYEWAIQQFRRTGAPQVLSNSWGYVKAVKGVTDNPNHPANRKILEAIKAGIMVLFSAGNCGDPCFNPDRCGSHGPGQSIHGMNGHPLVITVGAANIHGVRAGYSAQGPANFDTHKPDFCAPTHFTGYFISDTGTSASCPIAAGVVALMKQAKPALTQAEVKHALSETAKDMEEVGWDTDTGAGMIQALEAFKQVNQGSRE